MKEIESEICDHVIGKSSPNLFEQVQNQLSRDAIISQIINSPLIINFPLTITNPPLIIFNDY